MAITMKLDPNTPWYSYLKYQSECKKGKDSVQEWLEQNGKVYKQKKKTKSKPKAKKFVQKVKDIFDNPKTKAVEIQYEGKMYPSITACAKEYGVSAQTISRRLGRYSK